MLRYQALTLIAILGMALGGAATGLAQTTEGTKQDQPPPAAQPTAPFMGNSDSLEGNTGKQDSEAAPPQQPEAPPPPPPQQGLPQALAGQQLPSMGSATSPLPSRGYLGQPRENGTCS